MTKLKAGILVIALLLAFGAGWKKRDSAAHVDELEFIKEVAHYQQALQKRLDNVEYIEPKTKIIEREVIKYVKTNTVSCELNDGWVRIHDGAATGKLPTDTETARVAHGSTEAITVIAENYGSCRETIAKLEALQKWVDELRR